MVANSLTGKPAHSQVAGGVEFFPVAAREARVAARKVFSYGFRTLLGGLFVAVAFRRIYASGPNAAGTALFQTLGVMAFLYATLAGVGKTFDALAREKREGTLGLLLLTDLKPFQILFGKLLASSALTVFGLLAFLPILSLPLIFGGVTFDQFVRLALSLSVTLLLSMAWGLYISAALRSYVAALTGGIALALLFAFLPMHLALDLNAARASFPLEILPGLFSPALPFVLAFTTDPDLVQFFFPALLGNFLLALGWLGAALQVLPGRCHEAPGQSVWREKAARWWHRLRFGTERQRAELRERMLAANPLYWLAGRERASSLGLIAGCAAALIVGSLSGLPQLGLLLASLAISFRMAHASAHSISEDQKNGALELLLSTSLSVPEIVAGLNRAMLRRFVAPVALVLVWPWLFLVANADGIFISLIVCSSVLLLATWLTLAWTGPWFALRKKPTAAAWTTLAVVALPPWLIWFVSIFPGLFDPSYLDLQSIGAVVCSLVGVFHCILVTRWARAILRRHFREAAADPFGVIRFEPALQAILSETQLKVVHIGQGEVQVSRWGRTACLIAVPREGHRFVAWGGHVRGCENPLHIDLQGSARVVARFASVESEGDLLRVPTGSTPRK